MPECLSLMNKESFDNMYDNLAELDVVVSGLAFTSRTETLENYLKDKVKSLNVILISSCFLKDNLSSCRTYEKGIFKNEFKLPNFRIKDYKWYRQPLILLVFVINWLSIIFTVLKLRKKFDLFIGISHSFSLIGILLKKLGVVKKVIYYCIDYYIPEDKKNFNSYFVRTINIIERFIAKNADYIWDISSTIPEYREKIGRVKKNSYNNVIVPLGYSSHLRAPASLNGFNRWDIGFIGTITPNQGLQLLVDAMPLILKKFPKIKVKIIGHGPFSDELKQMVSEKGLNNYFTFFGFIKEEEKALEILRQCAVGVALWSDSVENKNIMCADPGKTKLYALCGLPIIVTRCSVSDEIKDKGAGIVVDYNVASLRDGIDYIMEDEKRLKKIRNNSFNLGGAYISDNIFNNAFKAFL